MKSSAASAVQLTVDTPSLIEKLRFAFTDRTKVINELAQNARRSGASAVHITLDQNNGLLIVEDDGHGIDDFSTLLRVASSGWDLDVVERENAFGVGFLSCLYSAERIAVESNSTRLSAPTANLLRFDLVELTRSDRTRGTRVELLGVDLRLLDSHQPLRGRFDGFPIQVFVNGAEVEREHAIDAGCVPCGIGHVRLSWDNDPPCAYLQGFCVSDRYRRTVGPTIVHLDSTFHARLPDRDTLIDADEANRRIEAEIKRLQRERLIGAKKRLSPECFVRAHWAHCVTWSSEDLLLDMPCVPARLFTRVVHYPCKYGDGPLEATEKLVDCEELLPREFFESKGGSVYLLPDLQHVARCSTEGEEDEDSRSNVPELMFLFATKALVLEDHLPEGHWAWAYVKSFENDPVRVVTVNERPAETWGFEDFYGDLVFCESIVLNTAWGDQVELRDDALAMVSYRTPDKPTPVILVPDGENCGRVVNQVSAFTWDDIYEERAKDQAERDLDRRIESYRASQKGDFASLIAEAIRQNIPPDTYPGLGGRKFRISLSFKEGAYRYKVKASEIKPKPQK